MENKKELKKHTNIRVVWGLLCSMSSIDQERNNISLSNVITQINVQDRDFKKMVAGGHKGLMIPVNYELVIMFRRMGFKGLDDFELTGDLKISFVNPAGEIISEVLSPIKFKLQNRNHGHRINFDSFAIQFEGDYEYRISVLKRGTSEFVHLYSIPLSVERLS